jgi:hypothetical protein
MFINKQTKQYPVTEQQIRLENPNVSFSVPFYPPEDYAVVFPAPKPVYDAVTQGVRELQPVLTSKGHYEQVYEVYDLPEDVVLANQQQAFQQKLKQFDDALVNLFEEQAKSKRYDSRITFMVRAGFPGPYQAEAIKFATWVDSCNVFAYKYLEDVVSGIKPIPTLDEFLSSLPELIW